MKDKVKNIIISLSFFAVLLGFMLASIIIPDKDISYSERRKLNQLPEFSWEVLVSGNKNGERYFDLLEDYFLDQFAMRDEFRTLNSATRRYAFMQKDVDGIYVINNKIFKMDYKLNEKAIERSADVYLKVINKYFKDNGANIYYTVVPDKNYYSATQNGYLALDYEKLYSIMDEKLNDYSFIDVRDLLSEDDYYNTDLHWDQSKIIDVANRFLSSMGGKGNVSIDDYVKKEYYPFHGSYYGQAALPIKSDTITYLTNSVIDNCKVFDYEKQDYVPLYAEEKLGGVDTYDVFLWGARAALRIENPDCKNGKELVIFRDSFGSSLAPLLVSEYSTVTILDLRYISSDYIGHFVEFSDNCDVLFMYNPLVLNSFGAIS